MLTLGWLFVSRPTVCLFKQGYYRKGAALFGLDRHEEASMAYEESLEKDPDNKQIKDLIGMYAIIIVTIHSNRAGRMLHRVDYYSDWTWPGKTYLSQVMSDRFASLTLPTSTDIVTIL
jgi:hypothetical protein